MKKSELRKMITEEIQLLTESFTDDISKTISQVNKDISELQKLIPVLQDLEKLTKMRFGFKFSVDNNGQVVGVAKGITVAGPMFWKIKKAANNLFYDSEKPFAKGSTKYVDITIKSKKQYELLIK